MQRISFRVFFVLFLLAGIIIAGGVALYWQQVGQVLERDVRTHVASAGEEAAADFNRLLDTDRQVLESLAVTAEDTYPWANPDRLQDFLRRQTRYNSFKMLGVATEKGELYLSAPRAFAPSFITGLLANTRRTDRYLSIRQTDPADGADVLIQAVPLHQHGNMVGVLFALQETERYRPLLSLAAMGNEGYSYITLQDGTPILGRKKPQFANIFDLLSYAQFEKGYSVDLLRQAMQKGEHSLVSYRLNGAHRFLHFIPLEANGWYMLSVLPTEFVEHQAHQLMGLSFLLVVSIFVVFCALLFYILHMRAYSNRQLFTTAFVDQLTGADNFNRMCEIFSDKLAAIDGQAALLIFDINKFKVINDLHGYERGNQVLKRVACILRQNMQEGECFCRSVADNFILLLKYEDRRKFRTRLNNLATEIRRDCTVEDSCLMIDVAFGVYEIKEQIPFYIMLDRAHLALDFAKAQSVDKCRFYEDSDRQRLVSEQQIESNMEQALQRGDFAIYFQPKCEFSTGKMMGAEALVRWKRPEEGIVRPDDFIPVFEKNGFILRLDMFILEQAVKMLASWKEQGLPQVPVAVNFSRLHLNDSRYISQMRRLVSKHGVPSELIEVELTESVIFNNLDRAQSVIRELHREGFSVAMDDFGSGYSSLNVLKNLQFDSIKLDKEFLNGFSQNLHAQKVIEGTVSMIKSLGVKVIAEGVETQQQADFLRKTGCDLAQGYFFARPLPAEEFEAVLKRMQP